MEGRGLSERASLWVGGQLNRRGFLGWCGRGTGAVAMGVGLALGSHGLALADPPTCSDLVCTVCYVGCCVGSVCYCCNNPGTTDCPNDPSCCLVPNSSCTFGTECPLRYPPNCVTGPRRTR